MTHAFRPALGPLPCARVIIRDEEWIVRRMDPSSMAEPRLRRRFELAGRTAHF